MSRHKLKNAGRTARGWQQRRGVIVVLTAFLLTVLFAFVALSVDTGRVVLTETQMQNAADAASLAASQEIEAAVYEAGQGQGSATIDANSIAVEAARNMAEQVAAANDVYIDPQDDVQFGKRIYNPVSGNWTVQWNGTPYNVVKVTAHRDGSDLSAPDGEFPLAFGWAIGKDSVPLTASSTAFTEARDLVLVLDWSASMNDDSSLNSSLSLSTAEDLLDDMWDELVAANPKFPGTSQSKFPSTGFGSINSYAGTYVSSTDTATIRNTLGLNTNVSGNRKYPFPQPGRNSDDSPKNKPSNSSSDSLWDGYINWVKNHSNTTYKKKYGYRTLMDYLQQNREDRFESEDLWRTSHYPFRANVKGTTMFLQFLEDLDFGDEVGLVGYGQWAVKQTSLNDGEVSVSISSDPITKEYDKIDTMQKRHQAGEYEGWTAMGDGILKAREMLVGTGGSDHGYTRYGARPTMIVMTDGQTNQKPSGWSLPASFKWKDWTDYDGDGVANFSTSDNYKRYAFWEATEAVKRGITIHTIAVGAGADRNLMKAIAFAGGGVFIDVPVHSTIQQVEEQLSAAFSQIAAKVPPAQLMYED